MLLLQSLALKSESAEGADVEMVEGEGIEVTPGKGKAREEESSEEEEDESEVDTEMADPMSAPRHKQRERIVSPDEVRAHLRLLFETESTVISLLYAPHGPLATARLASTSATAGRPKASADIFFMDVISVPPTKFRPASTMGDQVFENQQNSLLNAILRQTFVVRDYNTALTAAKAPLDEMLVVGVEGKPKVDKVRVYTLLLESLIGLQVAVNSYIDTGKNPTVMRGGKLPPQGVKQMLEKKEGLFRMNMMVRISAPLALVLTPRRRESE